MTVTQELSFYFQDVRAKSHSYVILRSEATTLAPGASAGENLSVQSKSVLKTEILRSLQSLRMT